MPSLAHSDRVSEVPGGSASAARVEDLHVTFARRSRPVHAVRGVDLVVTPGEIVGLVGESGSGKTVLGLALLGLLPDAARIQGRARVGRVDMVSAPEETRRLARRDDLGAVFQDPMSSLNPTMRVGRQVLEVAGSREEATRLLDACGIADASRRMRQFPHELSGGLRQRVMLAIALAGSPKLIIADEPTTALDVTVQAQVLRLFRQVRDEFGCAIVLVTHDLAVARTVADRICVMYAGRIVELGASADTLESPGHPYTGALLSARIGLDADPSRRLPTLKGEPPDPTVDEPGCSFSPRCPRAEPVCTTTRPLLRPTPRHAGVSACHFNNDPAVRHPLPRLPWAAPRPGSGGAEVTGLRVAFPLQKLLRRTAGPEVLRGIDLSVEPGESLALVGESGSGKSTLLRVLAGLLAPSSGTVRVPDKRPQMVFQDPGASLTPWLTVGELLADRIRERPVAQRRTDITRVLARLGLGADVVSVRPRELSGGQRQRVALARAIIDPPELLLCDEPISALDASLAATVLNLLGELRRELGFAMVFVTHDLAAARLVADRIAVMTEGRLVEQGAPDDIIRRPTHDYTRALLSAVPRAPVPA